MNASERMSENEYDNRVDPCYRASEFTTDLNNIDIPLEVRILDSGTESLARSDSKYYLNSHKDTPLPNDNIRQSRRDSTESIAGQSPTLTDSQQIKLNNILHTGEITNNNISTFSDYEFADSSFVEDVLDEKPEKGCCYLI